MASVWRQGGLVAPDDARALGLLTDEEALTQRLLVVSHSCDIASTEDVEPDVELLCATVVTEQVAQAARNGHSIRKLHVSADGRGGVEWLEVGIARRKLARKSDLLTKEPWADRSISIEQRGVLRRWLAQRYSRSEFPDAFIDWLNKGSGVGTRFDRWGSKHSASLVSIYFDLNDDSEREDPNDPYALGIHLVYATADEANELAAREAATELTEIFNRRCLQEGRWRWIELVYCDPIADSSFSLLSATIFQRWRFEHRSVAGEPIDEVGM